ncbi:MAG: cell surface protein, partial [Stenotrophomonas sp.]|nr:cell surface protein [Stenotrophomonas sp.]
TAVGAESSAGGSVAASLGFRADASGDFSTAVGGLSQASAFNATAVGNSAIASGSGSLALGGDAVASGARSVALGAGSQALEANVVSVGGGNGASAPATRRIVNVAEGRLTADSSDAVTGSQLTTTNQRVGAVETKVSDIDNRIGGLQTTQANTLAYDDSEHGKLTFSGTQGTVVDNIAAGSISGDSRQAVNGGQLFQSLANAASMLGGGASVGLQGVFVAPNYIIQGNTYNNVGDALTALDSRVSNLGQSLASGTPVSTAPSPAAGGNGPSTAAGGALPVATPSADVSAQAVVGQGAVASGAGATAIGLGATASADNSVALGQGSVADRANSVSVGSVGNE